jgi:hypothetical protein
LRKAFLRNLHINFVTKISLTLTSFNEDQTGSLNEEEHVDKCIKAVNDYREQHINKWEAVTQISTAIQSATASMDNEQQATAGGIYLVMLNEHD